MAYTRQLNPPAGSWMIVRLKGVKTVRAKGHTYYYHRKTLTRLEGKPGTAEFVDKLRRLQQDRPASVQAGTLGGLLTQYRASPEFAALAPLTQQSYRGIFDILRPNADRPLVTITAESLYELRDRLAAVRARTTVNKVLIVLRLVFNWAIKRGVFKGANPVEAVDKLRRPKASRLVNRPWTPEEIELVLSAAPPKLRLALAIAAYTGLRESDVVRVTWAHYDGAAFETKTQKTDQRVWIPAHSKLREELDALFRISATDTQDRIIGGTPGGLRSAFYRLLRTLPVQDGLSIHGLRHTLGKALAEAGCDAATIAAVLGHATSRMAEHYSRAAVRDQLVAAGMAKLDR